MCPVARRFAAAGRRIRVQELSLLGCPAYVIVQLTLRSRTAASDHTHDPGGNELVEQFASRRVSNIARRTPWPYVCCSLKCPCLFAADQLGQWLPAVDTAVERSKAFLCTVNRTPEVRHARGNGHASPRAASTC